MGCGASKCGEGDIVNLWKSEGCIVSLCKERKDLIRCARESRNAVSASHVLYLQYLLDFGEALDALLKDAIVDHCSFCSEVDSPLHSVDGSPLEVSSVDSGSVFLGSLTDQVYQSAKDGKTKLLSVDNHENENQILKHEIVSRFISSSPQVVTEVHDAGQEFHTSVVMEHTSNAPPMCNHPAQNNQCSPANGIAPHPRGTMNTHYNKGYNFSNYVDGLSFTYPADSSGQRFGGYGSERPTGYFRGTRQDYQPDAPPMPNPVPSPPMANSTMDYFNVLSFTDNIYSSYYSRNIFDDGLGSGYPYLYNALEKEGIPPLEQTEEKLPSKPDYISKVVKDTHLDAIQGTSVAQPVESNEGLVKGGKTCNHIHRGEEIVSINPSVGKDDNVASTLFSSNSGEQKVGSKTTTDDAKAKHSFKLKQAIVVKRPVMDIFETIHEISQAFLTAYNSGKEVTDILEVEKIPYLPMESALKGFYHIIPNAIEPSTYALLKKSACKILKKTSIGSSYNVKDISYKQGTMTSTLDKLYLLEKKLYKEVKIEEDLRAAYEKSNKRWKMLVNKGAEPQEIEAMQLKIKTLLPKIDVSVSSIRSISRRIHQAMNEELHPQLFELIHGLSRMWKSMSECHRSQLQAAMDAKEHNAAKMQHLDMKCIENLKLKVLKCRSSLYDLINTEKAFAIFLVNWLSKFQSQNEDCEEQNVVHPSSPCKTEVPDVAVVCGGWLRALEATSVSRVSEALEEFAVALHNLYEKQSEEQALRLRMEFLEAHINASARYKASPLETSSGEGHNMARKMLGEQKAAHDVALDQLKYAASSCVTDCMVKVFSALECFCTDMSNAYDQINVS